MSATTARDGIPAGKYSSDPPVVAEQGRRPVTSSASDFASPRFKGITQRRKKKKKSETKTSPLARHATHAGCFLAYRYCMYCFCNNHNTRRRWRHWSLSLYIIIIGVHDRPAASPTQELRSDPPHHPPAAATSCSLEHLLLCGSVEEERGIEGDGEHGGRRRSGGGRGVAQGRPAQGHGASAGPPSQGELLLLIDPPPWPLLARSPVAVRRLPQVSHPACTADASSLLVLFSCPALFFFFFFPALEAVFLFSVNIILLH